MWGKVKSSKASLIKFLISPLCHINVSMVITQVHIALIREDDPLIVLSSKWLVNPGPVQSGTSMHVHEVGNSMCHSPMVTMLCHG